jgi:hypothetical protein
MDAYAESGTFSTLTSFRIKFPVPPPKFPDLRNIFPVNLRREFAKKSLRHSGFWRWNRRTKPLNRKIPGIMAQTPQAKQR